MDKYKDFKEWALKHDWYCISESKNKYATWTEWITPEGEIVIVRLYKEILKAFKAEASSG